MTLQNLLDMFNIQLANTNVDSQTLCDWANELISYICDDCNFIKPKSHDYVITDTLIQDPPVDFKQVVNWYIGNDPYLGKILYREDGKFLFRLVNTYTLVYKPITPSSSISNVDVELPVNIAFHTLFMDYLRGKFYNDSGEGDEETQYGMVLINNVKSAVTRIGDNVFNSTQGPVKPSNVLKWSRGLRTMGDDDE